MEQVGITYIKMNRKQFYLMSIIPLSVVLLTMAFFSLVAIVQAETQSFGTYKQNEAVRVIQLCSNQTSVCDWCNLSSIEYQLDSNTIISNKVMTKTNNQFNYTFPKNYIFKLGTYSVNGICQAGTEMSVFSGTLTVTPSGYTNVLGLFIIIMGIVYLILIVGIFTKDITTTMIGGMLCIVIGLYTLNNGIDVYRNFATQAISLFTIGFGGYWAFVGGLELMEE
jgi:hypothetical protein